MSFLWILSLLLLLLLLYFDYLVLTFSPKDYKMLAKDVPSLFLNLSSMDLTTLLHQSITNLYSLSINLHIKYLITPLYYPAINVLSPFLDFLFTDLIIACLAKNTSSLPSNHISAFGLLKNISHLFYILTEPFIAIILASWLKCILY